MSINKQAMTIYAAYPRKVGRGAAIKAISKTLKKISFDELLEAVEAYARSRIDEDGQFRDDRKYTPHPSTWFNQERWTDDRSEWIPEVDFVAAFETLRTSIREHGVMGRLDAAKTMDEQIMTAAQRIGWQKLCQMTEFNREQLFKQFTAAYKAVARGEE